MLFGSVWYKVMVDGTKEYGETTAIIPFQVEDLSGLQELEQTKRMESIASKGTGELRLN